MTSLRACYNAIGTYYNIAIEIYINFQCCQNHKVQFVDYCALVKRVCKMCIRDRDSTGCKDSGAANFKGRE